MFAATLLVAAALAAGCPEPTDSATLAATVAAADASFAAMDLEGFESRYMAARATLACLADPLNPADAAAYHRVDALHAFAAQDRAAVLAAYRSALAIQPSWTLPSSVAPLGHPLHDLFDRARTAPPGERLDLPAPREGTLLVDGTASVFRPADRPVILQLVNDVGTVAWTEHLAIGEDPPRYEPAAARRWRADDRRRSRRVVLAVGAGSAAAIAAGLLAGAAVSRARFEDLDTPYERLGSIRRTTNTLTVLGGVSAFAATGIGVTLALTW